MASTQLTNTNILHPEDIPPEQPSPLSFRQSPHHSVHHREASDTVDLRELPLLPVEVNLSVWVEKSNGIDL